VKLPLSTILALRHSDPNACNCSFSGKDFDENEQWVSLICVQLM